MKTIRSRCLIASVSLVASSLTAFGGDSSNSTTAQTEKHVMTDAATQPQSLASQLDATAAEFATKVPTEIKKVMSDSLQELRDLGAEDKARNTGDTAPDFKLPDAKGNSVTLSELLKDGPVVITWYRGGWCPYCNMQLHYLSRKIDDFKAAGAQLIAISPESPDNSLSTQEKNDLDFVVLSDVGNKVASEYGLVFKLNDELKEVYQAFGIDLEKANGDDSWTLPLSATYVVQPDGTISWAFVEVDYRKRAEPEEIVAHLNAG